MSSKKLCIVFIIVLFSFFAAKTFASLTFNATTITGSGDVIVSGNGSTSATFSTPSGGSLYSNFLNITGTLPGTTTAGVFGVNKIITSAGSSSNLQGAEQIQLSHGYTGSSQTYGASIANMVSGTGTSGWTLGAANYGTSSVAVGTTTGNNIAVSGHSENSSSLNLGGRFTATSAIGSPTLNVGVGGLALNAGTNVAGFFGLTAVAPTLSSSAALIADNGATSSDIFKARDNGTDVFQITNGGNVGIGSSTPGAQLDIGSNEGAEGRSIQLTDYSENLGSSRSIVWKSTSGVVMDYAKIRASYGNLWEHSSLIFSVSDVNRVMQDRMIINVNGNVGVGTNNPGGRMELAVAAAAGDTTYLRFTRDGVRSWEIQTKGIPNPNNNLYLRDVDANRDVMTWDITGNVGIATTNPLQKLEVNGGVRLNTATAKPTCNANARGTFWVTQGGGGVKDNVEVCAKDAGDSYAWRTLY